MRANEQWKKACLTIICFDVGISSILFGHSELAWTLSWRWRSWLLLRDGGTLTYDQLLLQLTLNVNKQLPFLKMSTISCHFSKMSTNSCHFFKNVNKQLTWATCPYVDLWRDWRVRFRSDLFTGSSIRGLLLWIEESFSDRHIGLWFWRWHLPFCSLGNSPLRKLWLERHSGLP